MPTLRPNIPSDIVVSFALTGADRRRRYSHFAKGYYGSGLKRVQWRIGRKAPRVHAARAWERCWCVDLVGVLVHPTRHRYTAQPAKVTPVIGQCAESRFNRHGPSGQALAMSATPPTLRMDRSTIAPGASRSSSITRK